MIRVVVFLIVVGAFSLAAAWLADRPGEVVITWQGLRFETSLMVLGAAIAALLAVLIVVLSLLRAIVRSPSVLAGRWRRRRDAHAYEAISRGLIAVGAGDLTTARKLAADANRRAPKEPLALLLNAQAAQLAGDREGADRTFRQMAARADTKVLGLHGLFIEAQRRDDVASARAYAEEAARTAPALNWAARAVLEFRCASGDWTGALALLERVKPALDRDSYRRQRAVMLTARALATEHDDRDSAKADVLEAVKLAPTLVPAAALAGRFLAEAGERRKASRIITKAWCANPHPDLAQAYADLRPGDSARDRLGRVEALAKKTPGDIEGALAIAQAALEARQFDKARAALAPSLAAPTRRIGMLMADIERAEHNDEGRAREWMARALNAASDPQWTADGQVSDRWLPVSPVSGRLDAFEWRVPVREILGPRVIEPTSLSPPDSQSDPAAKPTPIEATPAESEPPAPPAESDTSAPPPAGAEHALAEPDLPAPPPAPAARTVAKPSTPKPEPVIPIVHAPDDPGPEPMEDNESPAPAKPSSWRKLFE